MTTTKADLADHCKAELADLRALAHELTDDEWARPSLCAGWTVKDVYAHLLGGRLVGIGTAVRGIARHRSIDRWADVMSRDLAAATPTDALITRFDEETSRWPERGIAGKEPNGPKLADNVTHELDVRRAIGRDRTIPADRLAAALTAACATNMWGNKRRTKGLRFEASDVDWSSGAGATVAGPAADLLLAVNGRTAGLSALTGEGVDTLRSRIS